MSLRNISSSLTPLARTISRTTTNSKLQLRTMASSSLTTSFANEHITPGIGRISNEIMIERGEGTWVWLTSGEKMLDMTSGIGVTCVGHSHPKLVSAITKQASKILHSQVNIAHSLSQVTLIDRLIPKMPSKELDTFFFVNSGSEACENAVKVAKSKTGRRGVVVMQGSYHGRTLAASAMTTSKTVYSAGFGASIPGIYVTPFPYASQFHLPPTTSGEHLSELSLSHLEMLFKQQIPAQEVACIVIEPVLGEGGYVAAPAEYLKGLREICDREGIVLVFDEVQCGFGRTGKMFYSEYSGVVPDIQIMAKGIAGGLPLAALVAKKSMMAHQKPGSMGGTYAGNPLACAAGVAVLDVFEEEKILDNVNARSEQLFSILNGLKADSETGHLIEDVRGKGLMVGVQFTPFKKPIYATPVKAEANGVHAPVKDVGSRVAKKCLEKGMLILTTSVFDVIRFIPPLNISEAEVAEAGKIFSEALREVAKEG